MRRQVDARSSFDRLLALAAKHDLSAAILPAEALPGGICTRPAEERQGVFMAGRPAAVANAQEAWSRNDMPAFQALIDLPACCLGHGTQTCSPRIGKPFILPESILAHPLLAPLGISALPVEPCRLDCPSALDAARKWLELADSHGYAAEAGWLRECLSWAISWSELHGVTEVKTPLFKMCFQTGPNSRARLIQRFGVSAVEGSATGLSFPYAAPRYSRASLK